MTDDFLLIIISGLTAVLIVLAVQIIISKFQTSPDFKQIVRNLLLLIRVAILLGLTVGSFYYSLLAGPDEFHVTVAVIFFIAGFAAVAMEIADRYLDKP